MPGMPIERGRPGPGLLAHVLVSKYADHQPLYRHSEIYAREGVQLERSTLADWVGRSAAILEPLVSLLREEVMAAPRSEEHTSELQSLMRISYAVFCLKKKKSKTIST